MYKSIDRFLAVMNANGGMSMSNHFHVKIDLGGTNDVFEFLCDEAQLPNIGAATGTMKGRYMGEGQINYPHTRIFTEMQLGFQCDANMTPLLTLYKWYNSIFQEYSDGGPLDSFKNDRLDEMNVSATPQQMAAVKPRARNRTVQLNYPEKYCSRIYITKTELGSSSYVKGMRSSVQFVLEDAWPFAIDAVPLQFGSAQITKVTAQFYYTKHHVIVNDIRKKPNSVDPLYQEIPGLLEYATNLKVDY